MRCRSKLFPFGMWFYGMIGSFGELACQCVWTSYCLWSETTNFLTRICNLYFAQSPRLQTLREKASPLKTWSEIQKHYDCSAYRS